MSSHINSSLLQQEFLATYLQPLLVEKGDDIWSVEGPAGNQEVRGLTSILSSGYCCFQLQLNSLGFRISYALGWEWC